MFKVLTCHFGILSVLVMLASGIPAQSVQAQTNPSQDKVEKRTVDIWSDGTRLSGDVFKPTGLSESDLLPTLVLCHGWGGVRSHLNATYAPKFAAAGYVVLTFDYRGWGDSDSRMVLKQDMPKLDETREATVKVEMIRELVDPFDQLEDIHSALDFIEGEANVDRDRIGIWGTSFGGGLVVWTAAHDPRIKCVVSQVGAMDARSAADFYFADRGGLKGLHEREIKRARGEGGLDPVPQGVDVAPGLRGTPYLERFAAYVPLEFADKLNVPTFLIDAENEELFDIHEHSGKLYELIKDRVKAKYHIEPGITHYGIYRERYQQGSDMALEWFNENLKK